MLLHKYESIFPNTIKVLYHLVCISKKIFRAFVYLRKALNSMDWLSKYENATELYNDAKCRWPNNKQPPPGKWILASFDEESIIVYQAYNSEIAKFACENGHFTDCPGYNQTRMTCMIEILIRFNKRIKILT
jgi:hypothetical protein